MEENNNNIVIMEFGNPGNNMHHEVEQGLFEVKKKLYALKLQYVSKIYHCSFGKGERENIVFLPKVKILYNKKSIHSIIYAFLIPFLYYKQLREASVYCPRQMSSALYAVYSKIFVNRKIVVHCGYDWQEFADNGGNWIYRLFVWCWCWITYKIADAIIVTSLRHQKRAEKYTKKKNVFILRNAVDLDIFRPLNYQRRENELIFVGRLEEQKNVRNLILALTLTKNKVNLKIAGRGSLFDELKKLVEDAKVAVEFLGNVSSQDLVEQYYNRSTIFILPSLYEGHSNALTEAMACGIPVIVGDTIGNTEVVEHLVNGYVCGHTPTAIAEAIDTMINQPELRKRLAENALKSVDEEYNFVKRTKKEMEIILSYAKK